MENHVPTEDIAAGQISKTYDMIVHHVTVNSNRTSQEAIHATARKEYLNDSVVASMPLGKNGKIDIIFFKLGRDISSADLDKEYELHGLKPADPYALAAVNEANPAFSDEYPNCTPWQDAGGMWCYAAFSRWGGNERLVHVNRRSSDWDSRWWFAGVRK